jgi:hypothetical protein
VSRAVNLAMTEAQVVHYCRTKSIAISALESLPDGGVRLVCMSSYGAAKIRSKLKGHIIADDARRQLFRPVHPLW